jgi:hypothetical protein
MTFVATLLGLALSLLLGPLVLAVVLLWQSLFLIPLFLLFILFGYLAVQCMPGLLGLVAALACWPITYC